MIRLGVDVITAHSNLLRPRPRVMVMLRCRPESLLLGRGSRSLRDVATRPFLEKLGDFMHKGATRWDWERKRLVWCVGVSGIPGGGRRSTRCFFLGRSDISSLTTTAPSAREARGRRRSKSCVDVVDLGIFRVARGEAGLRGSMEGTATSGLNSSPDSDRVSERLAVGAQGRALRMPTSSSIE